MDRHEMCDQFCQLSEGLSASAWAEGAFLRTSKDANSPLPRRAGQSRSAPPVGSDKGPLSEDYGQTYFWGLGDPENPHT